MICVLKYFNGRIVGWLIAADLHDAQRQAKIISERDLSAILYRMEVLPRPGKYVIGEDHPSRLLAYTEDMTNGYLMLVS